MNASLAPPDGAERILGALVYVIRAGEKGEEVLMMERRKQPNLGLWIAPGGKVERDESPHEAALRELREETGLIGHDCMLRGLVTEIAPAWQWFLFIYTVRTFEGSVEGDEREGRLAWQPIADLATLPIPASDALFGPATLDPTVPFFEATMRFDAEERLIGYDIHRT